jgi:hypothetical protein
VKTFLIVLSTIGVAYCAMAVSYTIAPPCGCRAVQQARAQEAESSRIPVPGHP